MRKLFIFLSAAALFTACQESLEDRAEREAKEYTKRMCPTPIYNNTRTDSVTFDKATKTYTYHCSFFNQLDDSVAINRVKEQVHDLMQKELVEATNIKMFKEAGFNFEYVCHSSKDPKHILYRDLFTSAQITKKAGE